MTSTGERGYGPCHSNRGSKGKRETEDHLEYYCGEREKQGREEESEGSHGGGAEQSVLVRKRDGLKLQLA